MAKKDKSFGSAQKTNASQSFLKGAAILSASMIIVKMLGAVYKIVMTNLYSTFGDQYAGMGMGLFNNAYEMYIPLFTIATAGFPIAVSRLVSESVSAKRYKDADLIHKLSIPFFIAIGLICFAIMFFGSFYYINIISSPYSLLPMLVLSPTILIGCLQSIYRGYFQGMRNMVPDAVSEIIEASGKMVLGLIIAYLIMSNGLESLKTTGTVFGLTFASENEAVCTLISFSVAGSISGIVIGSFCALCYLIVKYKRCGKIPLEYLENSIDARSKRETFVRLMKTAIPIGMGAFVMSLSSIIDGIVIQNTLIDMAKNQREAMLSNFAGLGLENTIPLNPTSDNPITIHTVLWGYYASVITLMQVVTSVTQAFGTSAMPNVTSTFTRGNKAELKSSIETVLRLTMLVAFPAGLGLSVLAKPILGLLYSDPTLIEIGSRVLMVMGLTTIVTSAITPICSMLQGIGKVNLPLMIYSGGIIVKTFVTWAFVSIVSINIQGATAGSLVAYALMCVVAMYLLVKYSGVMPDFVSTIVKPLISAALCAGAAFLTHMFLSGIIGSKPATILAIIAAVVVYAAALLILRTFTAAEIKFLPKGEKIAKILEKYHFIG